MDKSFINKFLKGSMSASFGTLASVVFHFLSITLMARFASQEVLGLYFLIIAIANGGKILASLGLDLTLVHFLVSEEKDIQQDVFAAVMWTRIVVMLLFIIFVFFFGSFLLSQFDESIVEYQWYIPLLFALMSFRELFFYILQGLEKYRLYAVIQTLSAVLKFALIAVLSGSLDLSVLLIIESIMLASSLVIQVWVIPLRTLSPPRMLFRWSILRRIFSFGLPLYANSTLAYISNYGAVFIVAFYLTPLSIAAYEVARKIPEGMARLFTSFRVVYFPSLSSLFAIGDIKNAQKLMNRSLTLLAAGTFSMVLFGLLFSREIVLLVLSERYIEVQPAFVLLMLSVCMQLLAGTMGYSLVSAGFPHRSTMVNVVAMGLELLISLLLVPVIGYIGAAIAFVIMTVISQVMSYFFLRNAGVGIDLYTYLKPYLFLFATSAAYLLVGSEFILWRGALFITYIVLCIAFIPDCRNMILYVWRLIQESKWLVKLPSAST